MEVSVVFTLEELWLLQASVRHESADQERWSNPPSSLTLNDKVAFGILFCEDNGEGEACVVLDLRECLAIDYCVPQSAKSAKGEAIGKSVLRKSFLARAQLAGRWIDAPAEEPEPREVPNAVDD